MRTIQRLIDSPTQFSCSDWRGQHEVGFGRDTDSRCSSTDWTDNEPRREFINRCFFHWYRFPLIELCACHRCPLSAEGCLSRPAATAPKCRHSFSAALNSAGASCDRLRQLIRNYKLGRSQTSVPSGTSAVVKSFGSRIGTVITCGRRRSPSISSPRIMVSILSPSGLRKRMRSPIRTVGAPASTEGPGARMQPRLVI